MTDVWRALACLVEPPAPEHREIAGALDLGVPPDASEHTELFVLQLPPYASIYLGAEGMIGGEARDRVAGFWRALGAEPPAEPDHLAVLMATLAELAARQQRELDARRRDAWAHARRAFFWEHVGSWLPTYLDAVDSLAGSFHARWADLVRRLLDEEARAVGTSDRLPSHLSQAQEPSVAGRDALIDSLLAPARCGLILSRADLACAARELGAGVARDRRATLRDLLEQEPRAALGWLGAAAARWADLHRARVDAGDPVAWFWAERAEWTGHQLGVIASEVGAGAA